MSKIFYLTSFDPPNAYSVRTVEYVSPLSCGVRSDYVWAHVVPAFEPQVFMTKHEIEYIALAPRHVGGSVVQPTEWPTHVYVCIAKLDDLQMANKLAPDDLRILNWGLLYPTMQEALEGKF